MQNTYNKIVVLVVSVLVIATSQFSYGASGRRKHFLSHGSSVAAFGAGESLFSAYRDPAILQCNPSLMVFFTDNAVSLSRLNLFEGSFYNSCSSVISLTKNFFLGLSTANLSSGDIETIETFYSEKKVISVNIWDYVLSVGGYSNYLNIAYGLNFKYLYYDLYFKNGDAYTFEFSKEAESALRDEQTSLKEAKEKFKEVKCLYNNQEYLRATDMISRLIVLYPNYESPKHFYKEITRIMNKTVNNRDELDFGKITYARAYIAYYNAEYKKALNEWGKYISFTGGTEEVNEYSKKIYTLLKFEEFEKRESELNIQSEKMLKIGIEKYNLGQWLECIKIMEKLEQFTIKNNFSKKLQYYDKTKEYISKSVSELSKMMPKDEIIPEQIKVEYDEITADKKYTNGLVLYAQGKYYEAKCSWELALRLNPNHRKAKVALKNLKNYTLD